MSELSTADVGRVDEVVLVLETTSEATPPLWHAQQVAEAERVSDTSGDLSDPAGWEHPPVDMDASVLPEMGRALVETGLETVGTVGVGPGRRMRQRAAVDFGVGWLRRRRGGPTPA